jgi:hypothetical protein
MKTLSTKFGDRLILMWPFGETIRLRSSSRENDILVEYQMAIVAPEMARRNNALVHDGPFFGAPKNVFRD